MNIPADYVPIKGSERRPARGAKQVGACPPGELATVTICLRRNPQAAPLPPQQSQIKGKSSKSFSREEYAATYGATQNDIDRVTQFARSFNLQIQEASSAKRTVVVFGTVGDMGRAFAVELNRYQLPTHTYRGRDGFVHVPRALAEIVTGVLGLDNRRVVRHHSATVRPGAEAANAPVGAATLTPPQVAMLYDFPAGPATGQTVGVLEFGGGYVVDPVTKRASDVDTFCSNLGLTGPTVSAVSVLGANNTLMGSKTNFFVDDPAKNPPSDTDIEVALDLEIIAAVAQGANIAVYFAPNDSNGFNQAVRTAVHDAVNHPDVLSISWGGSELNDWSPMDIDNISAAFEDAYNMGVSVFVSSGDDGSDCGVGDGVAHVEYPGSDPWVVCCGGTTITNVSGSTFNEGSWNDVGASGGGISDHFIPQTWQSDAHIPPSANPNQRKGRGVPDVAGNASPYSGYDLWLYGTQFSKLVVTSGNYKGASGFIEGGTSAVAPLYAALTALINASRGARCPFLNPVLYGLNGTSALHDISDGQNNEWSGEAKPTPSYTSGPGWDGCTGLGRIDGRKLLAAIPT
jgi:kumamolisin